MEDCSIIKRRVQELKDSGTLQYLVEEHFSKSWHALKGWRERTSNHKIARVNHDGPSRKGMKDPKIAI